MKHHHYGHKHHFETHIPLKYPGIQHHRDPLHNDFQHFFGHPGDKIQKEILSINDPWLPDSAPLITGKVDSSFMNSLIKKIV